jgi:hypothetical protein
MEIVKKHKNQKNHTKPSPTLKKYLLIQEICQNKNIPKEINHYIIQHYIDLRNQDLLNLLKDENPTMIAWDNVHIPINYYHLLTSIQIELINEFLLSRPRGQLNRPRDQQRYRYTKYNSFEYHYFLQSKKDYQLFLTLPIELRKCLAQPAKSLINITIAHQEDHRHIYSKDMTIPKVINEFQVIQVKSEFTTIKHNLLQPFNISIYADFVGYTPRPIIPEEKTLTLK